MNFRLIGGILLIIGVSVGAAILALPIATAPGGFWLTCGLLLTCWLGMTAGALLLLEVNLALPEGSNLISMARATLGAKGQIVAWVSYLLLLYSLLSAYISGGADVAQGFLHAAQVESPLWVNAFVFTCLLGYIVYRGIRSVDYVNRGLMSIKTLLYALLLTTLSFFVGDHSLPAGSFLGLLPATTVVLTSFGYAIIIPSLRCYFHSDAVMLRKVVLIGSAIPLFLYIAWVTLVQAVLPLEGEYGLLKLAGSSAPITGLSDAIVALTHNNLASFVIHAFISVCILTAFLGVSLSLSDFLADGLSIKKEGKGNAIVALLTFVPPLVILLITPSIFIAALSYAGIFCVILLMLLPILMAWSARYSKRLIITQSLPGGRIVLSILFAVAMCFLGVGIYLSM